MPIPFQKRLIFTVFKSGGKKICVNCYSFVRALNDFLLWVLEKFTKNQFIPSKYTILNGQNIISENLPRYLSRFVNMKRQYMKPAVRSSHWRYSIIKVFLSLRPATSLKRDSQEFSCKFA